EAALAEHPPVCGSEDGAAARRQQDALARAELGEHGALALTETGFAFELEDQRDFHAAMHLDFVIEIEERQPEEIGHAPADRGLAGAHRAHEDEVGGGIHGKDANRRGRAEVASNTRPVHAARVTGYNPHASAS